MIFNFLKICIDNLYHINFQSNGEFIKNNIIHCRPLIKMVHRNINLFFRPTTLIIKQIQNVKKK
jgi:hypothetical protein